MVCLLHSWPGWTQRSHSKGGSGEAKTRLGETRQCDSQRCMADHTDVFFRQKCDTFSRSNQAVFELSTRFSQPQPKDANLSDEEKLKKDKLLFHELTQGTY